MKKKITVVFSAILCVALLGIFAACVDKELEEAKTSAKSAISDAFSSYVEAEYSVPNWGAIVKFKDDGIAAVDKAEDTVTVEKARDTAIDGMANVKVIQELEEAKTSAKSAISDAFSSYVEAEYSVPNWGVVVKLKNDGIAAVDSAEDTATVENVRVAALDDMAKVKSIADGAVATAADLKAALLKNDDIELTGDIELSERIRLVLGTRVVNLDLGGHRLYGTLEGTQLLVLMDGTLKIRNGSIDALSPNGNDGCYSSIGVGGARAKLYLQDLVMSNGRKNGLNVKMVKGYAELRNVTINSVYGGGIEVSGDGLDNRGSAGEHATADLIDCKFNQTKYHDWCSTNISASGGGVVNVYSGVYKSENYGAYIFSSGGRINFLGGEFISTSTDKEVLRADLDATSYPNGLPGINVQGGKFTGGVKCTGSTSFETGTAEGLRLLALAVNGGLTAEARLTADIDLTGAAFEKIVVPANKTFVLNGQGHKIKGVTQEQLIDASASGASSTIKNLTFE